MGSVAGYLGRFTVDAEMERSPQRSKWRSAGAVLAGLLFFAEPWRCRQGCGRRVRSEATNEKRWRRGGVAYPFREMVLS